MEYILLSGILAFLITYFAIPIIIQVAKTKKLFDEPDERKVHKTVIPTLGGVGIFAGFIVATLMCVPSAVNRELQYIAAAAVVIFFLGLKDDIMNLSANKKLIGQIIAAGIVIRFDGITLNNMHGLLGVYEIPHFASIVLTIFTIIVITNSFNLIDGIDGLAGSLGILTTIVFGIYFYLAGPTQLAYSVLAFSLSGSTIAFLIYNYSPAKIFMGDTGSLLIGLINSILVIKFINVAGAADAKIFLQSSPAIGFAILMIPLFDTLRVFTIRILNRRSPFSADRNHIHHYLLDLGFSHHMVTLICVFTNIVFIAIAYFTRSLGTTLVLGIIFTSAFLIVGRLYFRKSKSKNINATANVIEKSNDGLLKSRKIFSFGPERVEVE